MGKYDYKDHVDRDENEPKVFFLFCIANELAEANRLKRLQMSYVKTKDMDGCIINLYTDEELEDSA